jgi:alpha-aminoadipic semialdehyde synthase
MSSSSLSVSDRYPGFADLMQSFKSLGMLESQKTVYLDHWTSFVQKCLSLQYEDNIPDKDAVRKIDTIIPPERVETLHQALEWLSLVSPVVAPANAIPMPILPASPMPPIDIFAYLLAYKLRYKPHERDMVVMSHEVISQPRKWMGDPGQVQVHTSSLITYGTPRASAMARTVGLPVAIAALNVLDKKVSLVGVVRPNDPSVYLPVLRGLEEVGMGMKEHIGSPQPRDTLESRLLATFK